ncbi:SDR family NAD(P)-dependent oxidoreductase [Chitinophaga nivalis]|uniref:Glucose 1-dehydrogenase n=1 Tax=Chitinophaga nivalis TaxID=2991709 RepID=A0ABT3IJC8_9BACT|nr:glucose 1-dehydrogenase [Chitinophaga nivalis]MCW3466242.1 glucose 1-dehydrogenase [Chitinophaga nivalis]MCW3484067.1 glucose 1-dehydrogenase [Chitinophaga nivalis]
MANLENKVAIVTGASSGIGKAVALLYAKEGATVVIGGRDKVRNQQVVDEIAANGGKAFFVQTDVSIPADCKRLVSETMSRYHRLDIVCNNAGMALPLTHISDVKIEDWQQLINTNLNGTFYSMHYQIPALLDSGGGSIVNMGSAASKVAYPGIGPYVASKHGMVGLTKAAALEYATKGIRINCVGPAFIDTPMLDVFITEEQKKQVAAMHPIGRMGRVEEVAELVLWLSTDKASFVTGSYYGIDGGYLAQ